MNLAYLLSLHSITSLSSVKLQKILDYFKDSKKAWEVSESEFTALGFKQKIFEELKEKRKTLNPEKYFEEIQKKNIKILTLFDDNYPLALKEIYDPPVVLYYLGDLLPSDANAFGVVGTRKITSYGELVTEKLTADLVSLGFTIVSGLARGVDTIAHKTALEEGGRTIAVLGSGLNQIYPAENEALASKIEKQGAVISEFPPDSPPYLSNFPQRNRIISGLSKGVLVTEAAERSGSLITARLALEQGREVFAVPGPITSFQSRGTANLIKQGARLTTGIEDIVEELGLEFFPEKEQEKINLGGLEEEILESLINEEKHIDQLCRDLKKQPSLVSSALMKLEIMGIVQNMGSGNYLLNVRKSK